MYKVAMFILGYSQEYPDNLLNIGCIMAVYLKYPQTSIFNTPLI